MSWDVATLELASDPEPTPKIPEPASSVRAEEIYSWASHLASESRKVDWILRWYVWPDSVREAIRRLEGMNGGIIGLVGVQGVGKTSALLAIEMGRLFLQHSEYRKTHKNGDPPHYGEDSIRFKWRRQSELLPALSDFTHEASAEFRLEFSRIMVEEMKLRFPHLVSEELEKNPEQISQDWVAERFRRRAIREAQEYAWLNILRNKRVILIDTPDYSKTDRRLMAKDLDEIYWLWNSLSRAKTLDGTKPSIVVAIQKEMFRDHFFFDKMEKVELEPLKPEQMIAAYRIRFKTTEPFTEDALLTLARMSRGIFRRFLRYITLTLEHWETDREGLIDTAIVKKAVTVERLAEDMEVELAELFPKQSDLRLQAVRLLMRLEESGPRRQTELAEELGMEAYAMSRLLTKLELHRYITRQRDGTDKVVSFKANSSREKDQKSILI